jgi:Ca2+-binding EF-hand superfamily protein
MLKSVVCSLCVILAPLTASAGDIDPDTLNTLKTNFAKADKDHDGKLTKEECAAGMPRIYRGYDQIDSEGRGYITLDEIITFVKNR